MCICGGWDCVDGMFWIVGFECEDFECVLVEYVFGCG